MTTNDGSGSVNRDPLLDRAPAARYLHVSPTTLDRLAATGQLHPVRIGRRVSYRVSELERFLDAATSNGRQ